MRDRVETTLAQWFGRLPPRVQRRLSGRPPIVVDGQRLEADVQLMLALREWLGEPVWDERLSVERARALTREEAAVAAGTRTVPVGGVRDLKVEHLPARMYTSAEPGEKPLLIYYHGGGFVVGDLDTHDAPCRVLCRHAGVDVLSVEYRKAPEHPFPGLLSRMRRAAYAWAASRFDRVAVSGDSAGGNIAATVAIELDPVLALLIYPVTDATTVRRSRELFGEGFFLTDELMEWYTGHYLPEGSDRADPLRSPILSPRLAELGAGAGGHGRLRPAARRGRGLRRGARSGRRPRAAAPLPRALPRLHQLHRRQPVFARRARRSRRNDTSAPTISVSAATPCHGVSPTFHRALALAALGEAADRRLPRARAGPASAGSRA